VYVYVYGRTRLIAYGPFRLALCYYPVYAIRREPSSLVHIMSSTKINDDNTI